MTSDFLPHHPGFIPQLAEVCGREWKHLYDGWDVEEAEREYRTQNADGSLPCTLVALEDGMLLGAVSLIYDDLSGFEHLNPWLASLFVLPEHRGKDVAAFLVREAETILGRNGPGAAYLFTESAGGFFLKQGWQVLQEASCHGHRVLIFKKRIL